MIVVTGGAGFIGSNLVAGLDERGEAVAVCDTLGRGDKWRNLAKRALADLVVPERLLDFLAAHVKEVETLVHLGAISSTLEADVERILDTNFRLSKALWTWCARADKRFVYASSAATYGDGTAGFDDDPSPAALARLRPLNPYGWSKHLFDRLVAREVSGAAPRPAQHVGLKFFNVYGPNEYHKAGQRSLVHQVYPAAAEGRPFALFKSHRPQYADGQQMRDFIWVGDCVAALLWFLDHPGASGLFNLGTGRARSFLDLAGAVYRALGREPAIEFRDMPPEIRDRYQYFTQANIERLRRAGYTAAFTALEDGVGRYVRDYLGAPDPYR
ncbi:MAG: ADP-glyceromanno-heptose 6-epimerase [Pseudomonadota bacterium]